MTPVLSDRELDVLELTAAGLTQDEVAAELGVHRETVQTASARVRVKFGATTTAHAVALAYVRGLLGGRR